MAPKNENLPVDAEMKMSDGGSITYANEVIAIISGIAANEIDGIAGMVNSNFVIMSSLHHLRGNSNAPCPALALDRRENRRAMA